MIVSLATTDYTVTEGVYKYAELTLIRRGGSGVTTTVTLNTFPGSATGKQHLAITIHTLSLHNVAIANMCGVIKV